MTKVLITGANGQLGREMRRAMARTGCQCLFTDISELDITDRDAVCRMIESNGVNVIVNCAAYTNVDRAEDDRETADLINNRAVANLAMAAKEGGATLIHVSTDYVFDGCGCVPYKEDDVTAPTGVYGVTKLAGEHAVVASGCKHIIIRTAWHMELDLHATPVKSGIYRRHGREHPVENIWRYNASFGSPHCGE